MKRDFLHYGGASPGGMGWFHPVRARQTQALDDASRFIRVGQIAAGLFFAMLLLFAAMAPISGATVAAGE